MSSEAAQSLLLMTDSLSTEETAGRVLDSLSSLVARAQAGETAAFEQLMICTQHRVAATAWRFLSNREDSRDATQETYLRAYKYLKGFKQGQDFQGWLYRITVNVCRDMLRARGRAQIDSLTGQEADATVRLDLSCFHPGTTGPDEAALAEQRRAIVGRALATLPEKERTAVVLRDLEGRSTEEVARLMNTRPATVRSQVSTARTKIKAFYEKLLREKTGGVGR